MFRIIILFAVRFCLQFVHNHNFGNTELQLLGRAAGVQR